MLSSVLVLLSAKPRPLAIAEPEGEWFEQQDVGDLGHNCYIIGYSSFDNIYQYIYVCVCLDIFGTFWDPSL